MKKRFCALVTAISLLCGLALNGHVLPVFAEETPTPTVYVDQNFDNIDLGDASSAVGLPDGWSLWADEKEGDVGKTVVSVEKDEASVGNQFLKLAQTASRSGTYTMLYSFEPTSEAIVLEYRFKADTLSSIYLPVLQYEGTAFSVPLALLTLSSGSNMKIAYGYDRTHADPQYGGTAIGTTYDKTQWHTVKQIADVKNGVMELYIDGEKIAVDSKNTAHVTMKDSALSRVSCAVYLGAKATFSIDDLSVKSYVPAESVTFDKTALTLAVNEKAALKPTFTPANASVQSFTYTISNDAVAKVSANGIVTGVGGGTATITATPHAAGLTPTTITVTVNPVVVHTIPATENFNNLPENSGIPTGWQPKKASDDADIGKTTFVVVADEDDATNRVAKMIQTAKRTKGGEYDMQYFFTPTDQVVLEYRYKTNSSTDITFLPTLTYEDNTLPVALQTLGSNIKISNVRHNSQIASVAQPAGVWHTVKEIVDLKNGNLELYFDGKKVEDLDPSSLNIKTTAKLSSVTVAFYRESVDDILWIDDLSVKPYVAVDTEDELKAAILAGETEINVTGDITLTQPITVNKDVSIKATSPVTVTVNIAEGKSGEAYGGFLVTNGTLTLGENITVTNTSPDDQGVSTVAATGADAKVIVDGATVTSANKHNAIEAANNSYVTIKSGHVYGQQFTAAYASGGATIKLEGGKVGHADYAQYGLIASSTAATAGGNIEIAGGEVTYVLAHEAATSKVTVSGGTVTKYVKADNKGNVTITGGTINEVRVSETAGTVSISGGTFTNTENVSDYLADGFVLYGNSVIANDGTFFPIEVNFNDLTENDGIPKGWKLRYAEKEEDAGRTSAVVVAEDSNKVMKFAQTEKRAGWYMMQYDFAPTNQAVVFEYKYKVVSGTGILYMPSLAYNTTANKPSWSLLSYTSGGNFYYSNDVAGWASAANLKVGEWHTVKQIVDIPNKLCELYLDGERIELDTSKYKFTDSLTQLSCVTMFFDSGANGTGVGEYYFDDFKLSFGVPAESLTFAEAATGLELPIGGAKTLVPQFTPADTSIQGITYTSSNEDVVTVDENGKITAVGEGEATITAKSVLPNLTEVKIDVTVAGEIEGSISGTGSYELPVGGHTYLDATVVFDGGIEADSTLKYEASKPGVVTVDEYGEVLAVGAGTVEITITSTANTDIKKTVTVTVSVPQVVKKIYVAPEAKGTGSGEDAANATTLEGALTILAAIDKENMTGNIEVILEEGYYYRSEALALTDAHGGNNLYSVIFKAEEGKNVTIGGGVSFTGGFEESEIEGVYVYDLSKLNLNQTIVTRSMFVDGVRAVRAKGTEAVYGESVLKNATYLEKDGKKIGFICDNTELLDFDRIQDLEFVTKNNWTMLRGQVASVEEVDGKVHIIMDELAFSKLSSGAVYLIMTPDNVLYYENNLKLLDEPGEWYLNEETQKLYYMPREWDNIATAKVTLPILDNWDGADTYTAGLVTITGTSSEQQAQNIRFEGITFADTTWSRSTVRGSHTVQNNYLRDSLTPGYSQKMPDGAINVSKANGIQFLDCTFTRLGINAINMMDGVQNSLVQGSHFYDISGAAVGIGQPDYIHDQDICNPTDVKKMMKNVDVLNNYIHDIAVEYMGAAAISVGFAVDVDICHNEIFHIPYSGMHIGYGWESKRPTITKNLNVSENFIHDIMYDDIYDGGAVYTNGNTGGDEEHWNVISRNYFRNQGEKVAPMYSDTGSTWFKWTENVVDTSERLKSPTTGTGVNWGYIGQTASTDCIMTGNYYTVEKNATGHDPVERVYIGENILVADLNWPAEALEIIANAGLEAAYAHLRKGQVERIVTNVPNDGVELKVNDTFSLNVRFTDGRDAAITGCNAAVYYDSLDETIATVDENGVITAVADGQTTVRIKVLSNSIVDIVEVPVIIGDDVVELKLENVESEILLSENSRDQQLVAYGVTEALREVSFTTVEWYVDDPTIATVEDGLLKVAGVGETTLTVVGVRNGVTKTATYKIVVQQVIEAKVDYLEDIFKAENASKWLSSSDPSTWEEGFHWTLEDGERISTTIKTWRLYTGKTYQNELLTFRMSVKDLGNWPSIILRCQSSTTGNVGTGATGYIICMPDEGIELHRFNGTTRTQFYGVATDAVALCGPRITPNPLDDNKLHEIQVGAINEEGGVRLVMYIDGEEIFNVLDTGEGAIREAGYFGIRGTTADEFVLECMAPKVDYMEDIFKAENASKWISTSDPSTWADPLHWTLEDGERISTTIKTWRLYTGKTYKNELLTFRMSVKDLGNWPSIILRCQSSTAGDVGTGATGYIICMPDEGIELHRFNGTTRTQFYGVSTDAVALCGPRITPNPLKDNKLHDIQVGAINEGNAVRLVMYIDGVEIFNVLDDGEGAITQGGYFGIRGYTADEFVFEKINAPEISQNSLSLKGNIGVNYYTIIPDDVKADPNAFIRFTMADGEVIEIPISEGIPQEENGVNYYVFTCQVSAKEMGDDIRAQIFYGNGLSTEENYYSVKEYAEYILNDTTGEYDEWKPLMKAMLQYGAFAQKQFGYKTYDLVTDVSNADLSSVTLSTLAQYRNTGAGTAKAKFYGSSLVLRSETTMSVFFQVEEGANLTVKLGNTELEVHERGGFKYVDIENISAKNLCDAFTLTVSDGTETADITAYPLGYCYNVLSNADTYGEPLVSLAKALYLYHVEAKQKLG